MIGTTRYITIISVPVAVIGILTLRYQLPISPIMLRFGLVPIVGLLGRESEDCKSLA